ncbi:hypothetical protein ACH0DO_002626 [Enterococcus hirae]|uniref:hypothetical protein n=1 Tax=Enterococcus TaxID=1350 RepID=UPI0019ED6B8B|nr:hypothetical protein [Enterococcus hirae]EMF0574954.1 hypothetical protein [Enterococcus hirae]HBG9712612.1 hypothetical protein [Enterococcus faecium]
MALNADQRKTKDIAMAVLEATGKDYDTALDEFHQGIISNNQDLILKSLKNQKNYSQKGNSYEKHSN